MIGNGSYRLPLNNALNDADDMARTLRQLGFQVLLRKDLSLRQMEEAVRTFGDQLQVSAVGLFYYAGHGVQVGGFNYLVPIDAHIRREDEIKYQSLSADLVLEKMRSAEGRTNIVILDACRNNPFLHSRALAGAGGLAPMNAPSGTIIAYATGPNAVASDGLDGRNGLYTSHLLKSIVRPGTPIEQVFKEVRVHVRADSGGQQTPWETSSLQGDFFFVPLGQQSPEPSLAESRPAVSEQRTAAQPIADAPPLPNPPEFVAEKSVSPPALPEAPLVTVPASPSDALAAASSEYEKGNYQGVIALAKVGAAADPDRAWSLIGKAACSLGDWRTIGEAHRHVSHSSSLAISATCREKKILRDALAAKSQVAQLEADRLAEQREAQRLAAQREAQRLAAEPKTCQQKLRAVEADSPSSLAATWAQLRQQNYRQAITLAVSQTASSPRHAWLLVGVAACRVQDRALAEQAFAKLQINEQLLLSNCCLGDDIRLEF
ncbi:MAG TPA: caspase family protein [Pseudomonadota bacterium]|nr:caspase family protein [Pseudomonadota bacterium]